MVQLDEQHHKRISETEGTELTELYEYLDRATIFIQYRTRAYRRVGFKSYILSNHRDLVATEP